MPTINITQETNDLLENIFSRLNGNVKPEDWMLKSDFVHKALEEYATKLGLKNNRE